jgi:hypothetical protein
MPSQIHESAIIKSFCSSKRKRFGPDSNPVFRSHLSSVPMDLDLDLEPRPLIFGPPEVEQRIKT